MIEDQNSFNYYRRSILSDIKRIGQSLNNLQEAVMAIALTVEQLKATDKIRSAIWGGTGGIATTTIIILLIKGIWRVSK